MKRSIRIGTGAGYSGDRIEPAVVLAEAGGLDYLIFECLAERTIAIDQQQKLMNPELGYDPFLEARMRAVLPVCFRDKVKILTNMGAANPISAAKVVRKIGHEMGLRGLKIAAVYGDDVLPLIDWDRSVLMETGEPASVVRDAVVSANAYLGHEGMVQALSSGADVVITGRVADPSLFVAPMLREFGWKWNDWDIIGKGTVIGHLMECAGQVTGGYYADPGYKETPDLHNLGYPIAEVFSDGDAIITKVPGTGGLVSVDTCKEQLLYEIADPSEYITPDVTADFSRVHFEQLGKDRVKATGGRGRPRTDCYKVSIGYSDGFMGEGQISYGGSTALARAMLANSVVRERLKMRGINPDHIDSSFIGYNSISRNLPSSMPTEVRLRVVGHVSSLFHAKIIGDEVENLYTNGPSAGGGATKSVREVFAIKSTLIRRDSVHARISLEEVTD